MPSRSICSPRSKRRSSVSLSAMLFIEARRSPSAKACRCGNSPDWNWSSKYSANASARWLVLDSIALMRRNLSGVGTMTGVLVRSPDGVQGVAFMLVFPLTFVANVFVPVEGLPDGLRQVAEWNPISAIVAATRSLFGNPTAIPSDAAWPMEHPVVASLLWCAAILAVCVPLCLARFRARTTD